jgi:predicted lipid-binding transport protein (Tim44 family)
MGSQFIDIILFAVVAAFFLFQLWRVLGKRTGTERPPGVPPSLNRLSTPSNVLPLPVRAAAPRPVEPAIPTDPIQAGLAAISAADPAFNPNGFLAGARHAFDLMVKAFAEGDTATLRPLSSDDVYDVFAGAIRERLAAKETVETRILQAQDPVIIDARLDGRTAFITLKFASSQISVTRAEDGTLVDGDPEHPHDRIDLWTFSRNTRSSNPNWILVGTGAPA